MLRKLAYRLVRKWPLSSDSIKLCIGHIISGDTLTYLATLEVITSGMGSKENEKKMGDRISFLFTVKNRNIKGQYLTQIITCRTTTEDGNR